MQSEDCVGRLPHLTLVHDRVHTLWAWMAGSSQRSAKSGPRLYLMKTLLRYEREREFANELFHFFSSTRTCAWVSLFFICCPGMHMEVQRLFSSATALMWWNSRGLMSST